MVGRSHKKIGENSICGWTPAEHYSKRTNPKLVLFDDHFFSNADHDLVEEFFGIDGLGPWSHQGDSCVQDFPLAYH